MRRRTYTVPGSVNRDVAVHSVSVFRTVLQGQNVMHDDSHVVGLMSHLRGIRRAFSCAARAQPPLPSPQRGRGLVERGLYGGDRAQRTKISPYGRKSRRVPYRGIRLHGHSMIQPVACRRKFRCPTS